MWLIKVEQLDENGETFRAFTHVAYSQYQYDDKMSRITRAFNMERTRVTVEER